MITKEEREAIFQKLEQRVQKRNQRLQTEKKPVKITSLKKSPEVTIQQNIKGEEVNWDLINNLPHNIETDQNV